ncbi:MAG: HDOD domain-containing protein [Candidatus Zixiibacteriota bacterium]|nr:MAG: HDOD domain-containing protein [candidate division Zixibacteria bacterium]
MITAEIDNKVKRVVSNIRNLPTPPIVFHQIQKVINDPDVSAVKVASILSEDPAMSAKVLRLTNSAFYGLAKEIESVRQAVVIIGFEAVKNLVLSASVLDMFKGKNLDEEYQEKYWRHSLSTAFACRLLARRIRSRGIVDPDAAFSTGLLHDVGKMVICCYLPEEHKQLMAERSRDQESSDCTIEERLFGYDHTHIGAFLGEQWKIPHKLIQGIQFHHSPQDGEETDPIAYIVCLADYVAKKAFYDEEEQHLVGDLNEAVAGYLDVTEDDIVSFGEDLKEEYNKAETFMQIAGIS